jgi:hypothetical protein
VQRWAPVAVPIVVGLAAAAVLIAVRGGNAGCETWTDVPWPATSAIGACVQVTGLAHLGATVVQPVRGAWWAEDQTWYLVPLFAPGDVVGREVRLVVRAQRNPSRVVDFEEMSVRGRLVPAVAPNLPPNAASALADAGYTWAADARVLEADAIDGGEGRWSSVVP